jgi:hypothetical protein
MPDDRAMGVWATSISSPVFDPVDFVNYVNNPHMIIRPGTTFLYRDIRERSKDVFVVTHQTAVIDGVSCVVVHDSAMINCQLVGDTLDYLARDKQGNIWYFGEDTARPTALPATYCATASVLLTLKGDGDVIRLPGLVDTSHDSHIIDELLLA